MNHYSILSILAGICLLTGTSALVAQKTGEADVPRTISYQGAVTSTDGSPLFDAEHSITVTLYADPAGTLPIWQDTYSTTTTKGIFNLYLGSNKPLPASAQMNRPLWVGTTINGGEEMRPLTPLTASPYALNLPDHTVTTDKLADGAVTAEKVEMDYVRGFRVNGQEVSGKGTVLDIRGGDGIALSYDQTTNVLNVERQSRGTIADAEKGSEVLAAGTATDTVWSGTGDVWIVPSGGHSELATNDHWIGTSQNNNFTIKVNSTGAATGGNQRVMQYRPNATSANILGGHNSNSIGTGVGNIIAGGGSTTGANTINGDADYGTIGGGELNSIDSAAQWGVIAGGQGNLIDTLTDWGVIVGGKENIVQGQASAVVAGHGNKILRTPTSALSSQSAFIGSGLFNTVLSGYGFIGSGGINRIGDTADNSGVVSGGFNWILDNNSFIGSGYGNEIQNSHSGIVSGLFNFISGGVAETPSGTNFIGSGVENRIHGSYDGIGTGRRNRIGSNTTTGAFQNHYSAIVGGDSNIVYADYSVLGGGENNSILNFGGHSFMGGGQTNISDDSKISVISGGQRNTATRSDLSTISGGKDNTIGSSNWTTIAGGEFNRIDSGANWSAIGGGEANTIVTTDALLSVISGGSENRITNFNGTIAGGRSNLVTGHTGVIVGGHLNSVEATEGFLGGGRENKIEVNAEKSVISGGGWNTVQQGIVAGAIGGGSGNLLRASSTISLSAMTIPGGDNLIAQSWAQTVVGGWNISKGAIPTRYGTVPPTGGLRNAPIFIVGNGYDEDNRSNAFEVSYNGHSIVFDNNGTGGATGATGRRAVRGGTYTDNVIYGWAEVSAAGGLSCDDFGIASITNPTPGTYRITLNPGGPDGLTAATISCGAVVATLSSGTNPGIVPAPACNTFIRTSTIQNNVFEVYISQYNPFSQSCEAVNAPFKFHVTGRVSQ